MIAITWESMFIQGNMVCIFIVYIDRKVDR